MPVVVYQIDAQIQKVKSALIKLQFAIYTKQTINKKNAKLITHVITTVHHYFFEKSATPVQPICYIYCLAKHIIFQARTLLTCVQHRSDKMTDKITPNVTRTQPTGLHNYATKLDGHCDLTLLTVLYP